VVVNGRVQLFDVHNAIEEESFRYINTHVQKARVSLVRGTDSQTKVEFDICVNEGDGIKGTKIINDFKQEFPELKYLVIFLKVLLSVSNLNKTYDGGISSFGLILLVISYLQQQKSKLAQKTDEGEEIKTLLSDHLLNFLKLYGEEFNYKELGISVRKDGFYYKREDKNFDNGMLARTHLSLENPVYPDLNVTKAAFNFHKIQILFKSCYEKIIGQRKMMDISIINMILPTKIDITYSKN
jgi:non-canonical poly(A) RNA polymerase PAPD5/7